MANTGTPLEVTSKVLGHPSVAFTLQTDTHPNEEQIDRAGQGLEEAFGVAT